MAPRATGGRSDKANAGSSSMTTPLRRSSRLGPSSTPVASTSALASSSSKGDVPPPERPGSIPTIVLEDSEKDFGLAQLDLVTTSTIESEDRLKAKAKGRQVDEDGTAGGSDTEADPFHPDRPDYAQPVARNLPEPPYELEVDLEKSTVATDLFRHSFRIEGQLRKGGQGALYAARTGAGEIVAVKVLWDQSAASRDRLRSDYDIQNFCASANVLPLLALGSCDEPMPMLYVLMPAAICSLDKVLGQIREMEVRVELDEIFPELRQPLVGFYRQMLLGLKSLHGLGIAHCDLKPQNLLLVESENWALTLKIADFGFACAGLAFPSLSVPEPFLALPTTGGTMPYFGPSLMRRYVLQTLARSNDFDFGSAKQDRDLVSNQIEGVRLAMKRLSWAEAPHEPMLRDLWACFLVLHEILAPTFHLLRIANFCHPLGKQTTESYWVLQILTNLLLYHYNYKKALQLQKVAPPSRENAVHVPESANWVRDSAEAVLSAWDSAASRGDECSDLLYGHHTVLNQLINLASLVGPAPSPPLKYLPAQLAAIYIQLPPTFVQGTAVGPGEEKDRGFKDAEGVETGSEDVDRGPDQLDEQEEEEEEGEGEEEEEEAPVQAPGPLAQFNTAPLLSLNLQPKPSLHPLPSPFLVLSLPSLHQRRLGLNLHRSSRSSQLSAEIPISSPSSLLSTLILRSPSLISGSLSCSCVSTALPPRTTPSSTSSAGKFASSSSVRSTGAINSHQNARGRGSKLTTASIMWHGRTRTIESAMLVLRGVLLSGEVWASKHAEELGVEACIVFMD